MNIDLDVGRQLEAVLAQRDALLREVSELRRQVFDSEVIIDNLLYQRDADADE